MAWVWGGGGGIMVNFSEGREGERVGERLHYRGECHEGKLIPELEGMILL